MLKELFGVFKPSERENYLHTLAKEYHDRTEAYDRTVCTGPIRDGAIVPATPGEGAEINRHAAAVRRELEQRASEEKGIPRDELRKAIGAHDDV